VLPPVKIGARVQIDSGGVVYRSHARILAVSWISNVVESLLPFVVAHPAEQSKGEDQERPSTNSAANNRACRDAPAGIIVRVAAARSIRIVRSIVAAKRDVVVWLGIDGRKRKSESAALIVHGQVALLQSGLCEMYGHRFDPTHPREEDFAQSGNLTGTCRRVEDLNISDAGHGLLVAKVVEAEEWSLQLE